MEALPQEIVTFLEAMVFLFVFVIGSAVLAVAVMYLVDITQSKSTLRRNYPVVARFRYFFEHIGEFFRQYFFAQDREEMPFNRAQRSWAYRAAKNVDSTVAFGSTRDIRHEGTVYFVNCAFPTLDEDSVPTSEVKIGEYIRQPYVTKSLINISGMSFGALSIPAIRALSRGAKMAGIWLNTGEGGLSDYHLEGGCDVIFQIGTAKYGVRDEQGNLSDEKLKVIASHEAVKMFEIKLSQGAKPGKGGILPGEKVTPVIAAVRGIPVGEDSISPNRHKEIKNVEDLLDMIARVRDVTGKPVGFKAVMGDFEWIEDLCAAISKRGIESAPDFITIDSADGGTGAAPMSLMDNMGLPIRESLPLLVDYLKQYGLRDRVKVIASGKLINPAEAAWALCAGADFITSARGFMFALGCIQALQCNKNTCPTGITTHNKKLQKGLDPEDKAVRVMNYAKNMEKEIGIIAHSCGVKEPRELSRKHARIVVSENGKSVGMDQLFPNVGDKKKLVA